MSGTISEYCLTTINGVRCLLPAGHAEPCRFMLGEACSGCTALRAEVERLTKERDEARKERDELLAPSEHELWTKLGEAESRASRLEAALREAVETCTGMGVDQRVERWRAALAKGEP